MLSEVDGFDPHHARVLVVGHMGVGKTSLIHYLCYGKPLNRPTCTVGCAVEVKLLQGKVDRFIEFWDIGGHPDAESTRCAFYEDSGADGVLLVHDLSNPRSLVGLAKWVEELELAGIFVASGKASGRGRDGSTVDREGGGGWAEETLRVNSGRECREELDNLEGGNGKGIRIGGGVPFLLVGNKSDSRVRRGLTWKDMAPIGFSPQNIDVSSMALDEGAFEGFFMDVLSYHAKVGTITEERETWGEGGSFGVEPGWREGQREQDHSLTTTLLEPPRLTAWQDMGSEGKLKVATVWSGSDSTATPWETASRGWRRHRSGAGKEGKTVVECSDSSVGWQGSSHDRNQEHPIYKSGPSGREKQS